MKTNISSIFNLQSSIAYTLYQDDDTVETKTHIRVTDKTIKKLNRKNSRIPLHLKANGGATLKIQ